jgi:hypothetical protein
MKYKIKYLFLAVIFSTIFSCSKTETTVVEPNVPKGFLNIQLLHEVDGKALVYDTILYRNKANNFYSVSRVNYYITNVKLWGKNNNDYLFDSIMFIDASLNAINLNLSRVPAGNYHSISFNIGIDAARNIHNAIPNNPENISMLWPDVMGGGYHFLKLEGKYLDSVNVEKGIAIHIGLNASLVLQNPIIKDMSILENKTTNLILAMNLNEWFMNPYTFDFNKDGNYTMGDSTAMNFIKNNGNDVFYAK